MLQRYDIARNDKTNRLSIKEFAALETNPRNRRNYEPTRKDYSLVKEISYDSDTIRAAIQEGQKALISELRSPEFYPIYPCAKKIAKRVTVLFNEDSKPAFEMFFDDRTILPSYQPEQ